MDFLQDIIKEVGGEYASLASDIEETENYVDTGSYIFNAYVSKIINTQSFSIISTKDQVAVIVVPELPIAFDRLQSKATSNACACISICQTDAYGSIIVVDSCSMYMQITRRRNSSNTYITSFIR